MKNQSVLEIDAFIDEAGERVSFILKILGPYKNLDEGDFYCEIYMPKIFKEQKRIFGTTEDQAEFLAIDFAKRFLREKRLYDGNGEPVLIG